MENNINMFYICGFNIAIVSGLLITLFGRLLPRRRLLAVLLALGAVTTYTLLVGASPPVVRAAIMGGVGIRSMRERAEELGGQLSITQVSPHGTQVSAWLPLVEWK